MSITLYDLPSKDGNHCWSLNPWKTRMALNYKNIPYSTEWVEYPRVAPLFQSFKLPANKEGMAYTIPTVKFADGSYLMDSKPIAIELEKQHPSPSLKLDEPALAEIEALMPQVWPQLAPIFMPQIPPKLLNEESAVYFEETRHKRFGMPLSQLGKEKGGEKAWAAAKEPLEALAKAVKANGGPFVLGKEPSYADFVVAGFLQCTLRVNKEDFNRILAVDPAFGKLYEATKPWLARDDH